LLILARVNTSRISLRFTEPRVVLLCKTGRSNPIQAKEKAPDQKAWSFFRGWGEGALFELLS
jgi:hypothetical protein